MRGSMTGAAVQHAPYSAAEESNPPVASDAPASPWRPSKALLCVFNLWLVIVLFFVLAQDESLDSRISPPAMFDQPAVLWGPARPASQNPEERRTIELAHAKSE